MQEQQRSSHPRQEGYRLLKSPRIFLADEHQHYWRKLKVEIPHCLAIGPPQKDQSIDTNSAINQQEKLSNHLYEAFQKQNKTYK